MDNLIQLNLDLSTSIAIVGAIAFLFILMVLILLIRRRKARSKTGKKEMNTDKIDPQPTERTSSPAETFGLRLVDEKGTVKILEKLPVSIGRDRTNEIVIKDAAVSAHHARIYYDEAAGMVCIQDLDSRNGLFVNGGPTRKNILQDGVKITLGNNTLTFQDTGYIHPGSN